MELFSMEGWYILLRWLHLLAGITWIGMLYYFNFVQTPFFGTDLGGQARGAMIRGLVPNALWWFRWGAMFTFLSGWLIVLTKWGHEGVPLSSAYMTLILTGGLLGTLMWANVWFVIWPAQQVVIASAEKVAGGGQALPEAAARGARAGLASRTNTLFSIPMLFFMGAASHLPSLYSVDANVGPYWIVVLVLVALVELNALRGAPNTATTKPLATVSGTIHAGLGLWLVIFVVASILL
ncbi:MAG TPA: urate hydroxylase PuuD [Myxococcota bacterium]|nr:urate hydroxylase PuuD [Myxococcota bacterium]